MRRMMIAISGATLAAALMTGCSSSDEESSSPSGSSTSSDATSAEGVTQVGEAYCDAIATLQETDSDSDPQSVSEALDQAAENAPEGQKDGFEQVSGAYDDYNGAVQDFLDDLPDVPGVDEQQLLDNNRDTLDDLGSEFLSASQDLRDQLVSQGEEDCDLG